MSCGYCGRWPQTLSLAATQTYYQAALNVRGTRSRVTVGVASLAQGNLLPWHSVF